jgi:DNA-directed RNA polymerase subunit M/transcription elongation factor TFIIS
MSKTNPFNEQCPNCGSYDVSFFAMAITALDVVLASIVTLGLAFPFTFIVWIIFQIAKRRPNKKYTCHLCAYEWRV